MSLFLVLTLLLLLVFTGERIARGMIVHEFGKVEVLPLRGLLALLVVIGHASGAADIPIESWAFPAVAVFFFISGYGLMKKRLLGATKSKGLRALGGVVRKLLPVFIVASVIYMVAMLLCGCKIPLIRNIAEGSSSLPIPFTWYIPSILALYAMFYVADEFCLRNKTLTASVIFGVGAYWGLTAFVFHWPFYWWKAVGGFVSGMIFAQGEPILREWLKSRPRRFVASAGVILLSVYGLCRFDCFALRFAADHAYFAVLGPIIATVMFAFRLPSVLGFVGVFSYELYIVHGAFVWSLLPHFKCGALYLAAVLICSLSAGCLLHIVNRFLLRIERVEKVERVIYAENR